MAEGAPRVTPGFDWCTTPVGRVMQSTVLASIAPHIFSTRDASPPGVHQPNYDAVAASLGVNTAHLVAVRQVHGRDVIVVREGESVDTQAEADAIVSCDPARVILVRTADCVPILLADRRRRVVAAVHAGWRGTAAGVVAAAVAAIEALGVDASTLVAVIGPSIGPCCYQVDAAVRDAFHRRHATAGTWFTVDDHDRWRLDLRLANRDQLEACGLPPSDIHDASACTSDSPDLWYSHRRQGAEAGRMVAAIRLKAD